MQLKNKTEREQFLTNYKSWGVWKEVPELELKFYREVCDKCPMNEMFELLD